MAALLTLADSAENRVDVGRSAVSAITETATEDSASVPANSIEKISILSLQAGGADCASHVEARVHALNILRSLFRHSLLGESVTSYVAQGVIVAIQGFKGKTWAVSLYVHSHLPGMPLSTCMFQNFIGNKNTIHGNTILL
jgi:hypothetical protein